MRVRKGSVTKISSFFLNKGYSCCPRLQAKLICLKGTRVAHICIDLLKTLQVKNLQFCSRGTRVAHVSNVTVVKSHFPPLKGTCVAHVFCYSNLYM